MRNGFVKHSASPQLCSIRWAALVHTITFNFYDLFVIQMASNLTAMGVLHFCMLKLSFWNKINQNNPWRTTPYFVTEFLSQREIYKRLIQKRALCQSVSLGSCLQQLLPKEHNSVSLGQIHWSDSPLSPILHCHLYLCKYLNTIIFLKTSLCTHWAIL